MQERARKKWTAAVALGALLVGQVGMPLSQEADGTNDPVTTTPIKHVILIIGENRTFDHVFGTFVPGKGQTVWNLLSQGIVRPDGAPGTHFSLAQQWQASDTERYSIHPTKTQPYDALPPIMTSGARSKAPFASVTDAELVEPALPPDAYNLLTIGGTGLPAGLDTRFPADLPNGPFDIGNYVSYDDYTGDTVHRFFQMWQQLDCDITQATPYNPSGCQSDLFPWVAVTVGIGSNGQPQSPDFNEQSTGEGAVAMGFYNSFEGDGSYFTQLAHQYALSDNYHQAIMGGTGANHLAIGFGTTLFYEDAAGRPATPPANQIENPNPQPNTNNFYTQDGYSGGSYVKCADVSQPGVESILSYLDSLPYRPFNDGNCQPDAYYLVNNYNPGYRGDGTPAPLGPKQFTIPPSQQPNLGLLLTKHGVSWKYYGEGWANGQETGENSSYCNICNPFQYSTQIMTNPTLRLNLQDLQQLYADIQNSTLPAVSIVKPDGYLDGHPASSKFQLFEEFCRKIIDMVQANQALWQDTAVMITVDEGGGYYDSGYIQPIDFFGDGSRIPLLVVSPYAQGRGMVHTYYDHVSFDKFVEANWGLGETISEWSRDNLPNPIASADNVYVPLNSPAIGDLMEMFNFHAAD